MKLIFENSIIHKPSVGSREVPQKNLGPIGSVVLTVIGYKQTDREGIYDIKVWTHINPK